MQITTKKETNTYQRFMSWRKQSKARGNLFNEIIAENFKDCALM
jgi:hypothetical protein